ncbi:MAG: ABC transporter substrate binding protein [Christensenellales bacterium]
MYPYRQHHNEGRAQHLRAALRRRNTHYTGADSFALNGAFLGYGVDYANLGVETANMVAEVALEGKKPAELPVRTFDNGCATVNTETCEKLGYKFDDIEKTFAPFCTKVQSIVTAESFDELN